MILVISESEVAYCVGSGNISDGGSPRANENRINIHFVRYTSEMRALFVFPHLYVLTKPGGRILFFRIGINIYFVRNTHLLHRRNIICRTEDTWLSQNCRYILLKEAILYDYISFFLPNSRSNLKYLAVCQFKYFKYLVTYLTSENLAHIWKWKFLQNEKRLEN